MSHESINMNPSTNIDNNYLELVKINNKVQRLVSENEIDWELKYDTIFSPNISRKVFALMKELNVSFDYYDPDTSYEEDIKAFSDALKDKVQELSKISYMFEKE